MVKSGLVDKPHVSHFRLAAHLLTALSVMVYILWVIMDIVYPNRESVHVKGLKKTAWVLLILIILQITYGAFVAGLKAGFMYNTFPKMGANWIAPEVGEGRLCKSFFSWSNGTVYSSCPWDNINAFCSFIFGSGHEGKMLLDVKIEDLSS